MGLHPSASNTSLLLECQRPFADDVEVDFGTEREAARYGSAFHAIVATCLVKPLTIKPGPYAKVVDAAVKKWDVAHAADELAAHAKSSYKYLRNWLDREKLSVAVVEKAYAVNPRTRKVREIPPHSEEHVYDVVSGEIPGTVDLIAVGENRIVPLDHKTGMHDGDWYASSDAVSSFALPTTVRQMQTIGLMGHGLAATYGREGVDLAIFHADRRGLPIVYCDSFEHKAAVKHAGVLAAALDRIGDGSLRPGKWCDRCPARDTCPAKAADLLGETSLALMQGAEAVLDEPVNPKRSLAPRGSGSIEIRASAAHALLRKIRSLEKAVSDELRALVKDGAIIETPDGVLVLETQRFETLSKKSVIEALGKEAGERELKRLRKKGVVREATREMLVPRG